jgi:hypothetical protein
MPLVCTYPTTARSAWVRICQKLAEVAPGISPTPPVLKPSGHWETEIFGLDASQLWLMRFEAGEMGVNMEWR